MGALTSYAGKFLSLKDHVYYVMLTDPETNYKALGKIIFPGMNRHFKVNNSIAAHLLYLLSRPRHTDILFETMKDLVKQKYNLSDASAISELNSFLGKIDNIGILDVKDRSLETNEPDPCNLFDIPSQWDAVPDVTDLSSDHPPRTRDNHHYGCGNAAFTIWR